MTPTLTATDVLARFHEVRGVTEWLAEPLGPEDQTVQSMPDVSPTKWHRAHVTWFFETFVLERYVGEYRTYHPGFGYLFNSYYEGVGSRHPRPDRGLITRPGIGEVAAYRQHVDEAVDALLESPVGHDPELLGLVELGLHHEQQHQELLLSDIKHVLSRNPLRPSYRPELGHDGTWAGAATPVRWMEFDGGLVELGAAPTSEGVGFSFDNESPRHRVWLEPYRVADRLVTCGEWASFIDDGGYRRPELWLSDGWAAVQSNGWDSPLYWSRLDGNWEIFTLDGTRPLTDAEPVCHVSHYEADAFARWSGARLPTEFEWEHAVSAAVPERPSEGSADADRKWHPAASHPAADGLRQIEGDAWQWTSSAYLPYPRFRAAEGAVGEYNGKFMSNQVVLRGGACVTPSGHSRSTYRNFYPPSTRWAFGGVRLADDL